eukprot:m.184795 g.184795  ORF g.184795 m.184795 type:complete len:469 (-) comp15394_c0_seq2:26-1432(-)
MAAKRARVSTTTNPVFSAGVAPHPRGIQPSGNQYLDEKYAGMSRRDMGLGTLRCLPDELLLEIFGFLSAEQLARIAGVSPSFYALASHDDAWKTRVLAEYPTGFDFLRTWRETYISSKLGRPFVAAPARLASFYSDTLYQPWFCATMSLRASWLACETVPRRAGLALEEFRRVYEQGNTPVIITDVVPRWPAFDKWSDDYLIAQFGAAGLEAGPVSIGLARYQRYAAQCRDDLPLYIFDPRFAAKSPAVASDYDVPEYFREDLFAVLGAARPDHRWLIAGPARSGSVWHIDPNATSAWNAVVRGAKKWLLLPPGCVPPGVHPSAGGGEVTQPVSLPEWFFNYYDAAMQAPVKPLECIVRAGELLYVPHGWWHCVLNTEASVAITHNYVGTHNLAAVASFLRDRPADVSGCGDGPALFDRFSAALEKAHPGMLQAALDEAKKPVSKPVGGSTWGRARGDTAAPFSFGFG